MVIEQWNIYWAQLDPTEGAEQSGIRPVLVISVNEVNANIAVISVLPLTSMKSGRQIYPIETFLPKQETGLTRDSISMAHQIRSISKNRILNPCGSIQSEQLREQIKHSMRIYFDLFS